MPSPSSRFDALHARFAETCEAKRGRESDPNLGMVSGLLGAFSRQKRFRLRRGEAMACRV